MKRYIVFAFSQFYPRGGAEDIFATTDVREEADAISRKLLSEEDLLIRYVQILDTSDGSLFCTSTGEDSYDFANVREAMAEHSFGKGGEL